MNIKSPVELTPRQKYLKDYQEKNKDQLKEYNKSPARLKKKRENSKKYYAANREISLEAQRLYREKKETPEYKEIMRINNSIYYKENIEHLKAKAKEYRKSERGKHSAFMCQMRRNKRSKHLPHTLTLDEWNYCKTYFMDCCAICNLNVKLHKDHWIPISNSNCPGTVKENIIPLCQSCNSSKGRKNAEIWVQENHLDNYLIVLAKIHFYINSLTNI